MSGASGSGALSYPAPPASHRVEYGSREVLRALQDEGLRRLVERAWHTNPFYRLRWQRAGVDPEKIRGVDDIRRLPIVRKADLEQDLVEHPPFGEFQGTLPIVRFQASSGSFGDPKPIGHTARDWDTIANLWARRLAAQGVGPGQRVQIAFTYALFIPAFTSTEGAMRLGATVIPTGSGAVTPSERQLQIARRWGTTILACTGSYALRLAEVAKEQGIDLRRDIGLHATIHTAEPLPAETRRRLQEAWGCPAYDNYGSVETGAPAFECVEQNGLHINEDAYLFEVVDPESGDPVAEGEDGALVVTSLFKEAAPVIRYQIGDVTSLVAEPCACGRTFRRMRPVRGRLDEMIKVHGVTVYPTAVENVLRRFPELGQAFRLVVEGGGALDRLAVEVELAPGATAVPEQLEGLRRKVAEAIKVQLGVTSEPSLLPPGTLGGETERAIKARRLVRRP